MEELRTDVKKSSVRCKIIGPKKQPNYFHQEMAIAWEKETVYLRIGYDVYEGQEVRNGCKQPCIHLHVGMQNLNTAVDNNGKYLSDFAVTEKEYVFWPAGSMRSSDQQGNDSGTSRDTLNLSNSALEEFALCMDIS